MRANDVDRWDIVHVSPYYPRINAERAGYSPKSFTIGGTYAAPNRGISILRTRELPSHIENPSPSRTLNNHGVELVGSHRARDLPSLESRSGG